MTPEPPAVSVPACVSDWDEWHPLVYWEQRPALRVWAFHRKQKAYYSKRLGKSHAWAREDHGPVGVFFDGSNWLKLSNGKAVPTVVLKPWPRPSCDVAAKPEVCMKRVYRGNPGHGKGRSPKTSNGCISY